MKKNTCLALLMALIFSAGAVWADGAYVLSGGVGTKITSLPYTIDNPGYYYFGGNLSINLPTGNAITVNADRATLDLMGFSLTNTNPSGATAYGIRMAGRQNVEIRNGTIAGFQEGLFESSASGANHRLNNLRLKSCYNGIDLRGKNHLVKDCTSSSNYVGIWIDGGTISNCVACDNGNIGIRLSGAGSVLGNIANNNAFYNFYLGSGSSKIMVNRNGAAGLDPNYYKTVGSTGVLISGLNAGQP